MFEKLVARKVTVIGAILWFAGAVPSWLGSEHTLPVPLAFVGIVLTFIGVINRV